MTPTIQFGTGLVEGGGAWLVKSVYSASLGHYLNKAIKAIESNILHLKSGIEEIPTFKTAQHEMTEAQLTKDSHRQKPLLENAKTKFVETATHSKDPLIQAQGYQYAALCLQLIGDKTARDYYKNEGLSALEKVKGLERNDDVYITASMLTLGLGMSVFALPTLPLMLMGGLAATGVGMGCLVKGQLTNTEISKKQTIYRELKEAFKEMK